MEFFVADKNVAVLLNKGAAGIFRLDPFLTALIVNCIYELYCISNE